MMQRIVRQPPVHEGALWPDTLPASVVVPAGFTLYPPADLDLSETDLTIHGAVALPEELPGAASTIEAGLIEIATEAEALAGSDVARAVTPATLDAVIAALPAVASVAFNGCEFAVGGLATSDLREVTLTPTLNGAPVSGTVAVWVCAIDTNDADRYTTVSLFASSGSFVWHPTDSTPEKLVVSGEDGNLVLEALNNSHPSETQFRIAVLLPTGAVVFSESITLSGS